MKRPKNMLLHSHVLTYSLLSNDPLPSFCWSRFLGEWWRTRREWRKKMLKKWSQVLDFNLPPLSGINLTKKILKCQQIYEASSPVLDCNLKTIICWNPGGIFFNMQECREAQRTSFHHPDVLSGDAFHNLFSKN